jgi:hypothetical protein
MLGMSAWESKPVSFNKTHIFWTRKLQYLLQNKIDIDTGTKKNCEPDGARSFPEPKNGRKKHNIEDIITQQRGKPHKVINSRMVQILEELNNLQDYWSLVSKNKFFMVR